MARDLIHYNIAGPFMNRAVPENQVAMGTLSYLAGADPRVVGGIRKFPGMRGVLDIAADVADNTPHDNAGVDFIQHVVVEKRTTSTVWYGFVVRYKDAYGTSDMPVSLYYTADNGSNWAKKVIYASNDSVNISENDRISCAVRYGFLFVAVDGQTPKVLYWSGSAVTVADAGPGALATELTVMTGGVATRDASYYLYGRGVYQVAYRFYNSIRGIYSGLSAPYTITVDVVQETKAEATITFTGQVQDADDITINGRVYEFDTNSSITGDVAVDISGNSSKEEDAEDLRDAINGDSSAIVVASLDGAIVTITSKIRGDVGNQYTLTETDVGGDMTLSGAVLTGGGVSTGHYDENCKAVMEFPDDSALPDGLKFTNFDALFDKVEIFRSIDLGHGGIASQAILYLEQTLSMPANAGTWDSLQVAIGTVRDEALPFYTQYDSEKDIVKALPTGGVIARYGGRTFVSNPVLGDNSSDISHSSAEHVSPEYFTTYNTYKGRRELGTPVMAIPAGNALIILYTNAILHVFSSSKAGPLRYVPLHVGKGLTSIGGAHAVGNSIFMMSSLGLLKFDTVSGELGHIRMADRLISDDWLSNIDDISSAYDSVMNTSYFLNPTTGEILQLCHSTQSISMLEDAAFVWCTHGADIADGGEVRAYFITSRGTVVTPDVAGTGSGTMIDVASGDTINGTLTGLDLVNKYMDDSGATFRTGSQSIWKGQYVYLTSGDSAGERREIVTVVNSTRLTLSSNFSSAAIGDTYAISPVPVRIRLPRLSAANMEGVRGRAVLKQGVADTQFERNTMVGISLKTRESSGFGSINNKWRCGAYRNSGASIESVVAYADVDDNPPDSVAAFTIDGVDVEPYLEQISSGTKFELTDVLVHVIINESRKCTS